MSFSLSYEEEFEQHAQVKPVTRPIKIDFDKPLSPESISIQIRRDIYAILATKGAYIYTNPAIQWEEPSAPCSENDAFFTMFDYRVYNYLKPTRLEDIAAHLYIPNHQPSRILSRAIEEFLANEVFRSIEEVNETHLSIPTLLYFDELLGHTKLELEIGGFKKNTLMPSHQVLAPSNSLKVPRTLAHAICFETLKDEEKDYIYSRGSNKHRKLLELYCLGYTTFDWKD